MIMETRPPDQPRAAWRGSRPQAQASQGGRVTSATPKGGQSPDREDQDRRALAGHRAPHSVHRLTAGPSASSLDISICDFSPFTAFGRSARPYQKYLHIKTCGVDRDDVDASEAWGRTDDDDDDDDDDGARGLDSAQGVASPVPDNCVHPEPRRVPTLDPCWKTATPAVMLTLPAVAVACALAALSALAVVLLTKPVHTALGLLGHSLSMAALYFILSAQLMAVAQMLIYSGAIVVLFLIVVTLLPAGGEEKLSWPGYVVAAVTGLAVLAVFGGALSTFTAAHGVLATVQGEGPGVKEIGRPLFSTLMVPFELTAPLLLASIVAAIALWRRQEKARPGGLA